VPLEFIGASGDLQRILKVRRLQTIGCFQYLLVDGEQLQAIKAL